MHDSRGVQVYLSCSSRPILEHCTDIGFARYPNVFGEVSGVADIEEEWFNKEQVEDFNWLRKEHSPNWRILQEGIKNDTWSKVLYSVKEQRVNPQGILDLIMK